MNSTPRDPVDLDLEELLQVERDSMIQEEYTAKVNKAATAQTIELRKAVESFLNARDCHVVHKKLHTFKRYRETRKTLEELL